MESKNETRIQIEQKNEELTAREAKIFQLGAENDTLHASLDSSKKQHLQIMNRMNHKNTEDLLLKNLEITHYKLKIQKINDYLNTAESKIRRKSAGVKASPV